MSLKLVWFNMILCDHLKFDCSWYSYLSNKIILFSGCPDTYENMITRMGEIEKTLALIKDTVTTASG